MTTDPPNDCTALFLETSRNKLLGEFWPRLQSVVQPLDQAQLWWRPNEAANSIGNLLLHMNGNAYQWLVASFNHLEDKRRRPQEFAARNAFSAAELLAQMGATMEQASAVLARLTTEELLASYEIQGYRVSGLYAVYQVVEHFAMHYGQILYIAKSLGGSDLGFYRELDKTGRAG